MTNQLNAYLIKFWDHVNQKNDHIVIEAASAQDAWFIAQKTHRDVVRQTDNVTIYQGRSPTEIHAIPPKPSPMF
jgi:acid phosphatase class B